MTPIFGSQRFDKGRIIPDSFLEEFRKKDPSTRRYLLNSMTLFACISPEQQHQALNDLIQSELISLAEKSKHYMYDRVISLLQKFNIEKELDDKAIAEYYYRYYLLTGLIPENLTADYLNELIGFIIGLEIIKLLFSMRFVEQQRFFEIQGRYAMQVLLFYRYIKPIRSKIMQDKILEKDVAGTYYYTKARLSEDKLFDSIFEVFKLDKILGIGNLAKDLNFDKDYIYNSPDVPDRDSSFF
ncbi:hypothetical protein [Phormidium sp. CCY1219]|uniref:hypothetical protein n=1 Tax=Phormidium sp. CCY1219 TaxID=2886104 RepID=UPI002D1E55F6|nr:hypothetical protein [Phormidium sp. CCY1219]MEB3826950.1 hypothetical protein [Phormidium sp. CCY1219]